MPEKPKSESHGAALYSKITPNQKPAGVTKSAAHSATASASAQNPMTEGTLKTAKKPVVGTGRKNTNKSKVTTGDKGSVAVKPNRKQLAGASRTFSRQATGVSNVNTKVDNVKTVNTRHYTKSQRDASPLRVVLIGGMNEIGKNITLYEYEEETIIVDCGMAFPDAEMPGVDIVIPDFSYIIKNKDKIKGIVITHGHEDHIGSIPYLLRECNFPIYGTRLTLGLIEGKLREHHLDKSAVLNVVKEGDEISLGAFTVETIHVNHSIPGAVALAIKTPAGVVIHTGDFKIDSTPIDDKVIDFARFSQLGREGVLALMSDSTNAERPGYTQTERVVGDSLSSLFAQAERQRIIIATFSSNIHRIQQIIDEAVKTKRKVVINGRSMINVVGIASELGYLKIPENVLIDPELMKRYTPEQLVIITTGSQGEPMSALHRMAFSEHRQISIAPNDMIIISASPIPGNEKTVSGVINELLKLGAEVIYSKMYDIHVSGHACQEELKLMIGMCNPKFFMPLHGEQRQLRQHAKLAENMGIDKKNIIIGDIGKVIEFKDGKAAITGSVPAGKVLVDGLGVGDVGSIVLKDRKHLAEDGLIVAVVTMDSASGDLLSGPDIVSRGFVYVRESEGLIDQVRDVALNSLAKSASSRDWSAIKSKMRDDISKFIYEKTKRSPMILPIVQEV